VNEVIEITLIFSVPIASFRGAAGSNNCAEFFLTIMLNTEPSPTEAAAAGAQIA
jgi:hypothetical protein